MPQKLAPTVVYADIAILGILLLYVAFAHDRVPVVVNPSPTSPPVQTYNPYNPSNVCVTAWRQDKSGELNHSNSDEDHFDVVLEPGCFSGFVQPPRSWRSWQEQFVSDEPNRHVGYWFFGDSRSKGPYGPNQIPDYHSNKWRLQGIGTLRFFQTSGTAKGTQNQVPAEASQTAAPSEPTEQPAPDVAKAEPPPHEETSKPGTSKLMNDFLFTLGTCSLAADHAICNFTVNNRGHGERGLRVWGHESHVIDPKGYKHTGVKVTLGSKECVARGDGKSAGYCTVEERLPGDVPMAFTVEFGDVSQDTAQITYMEIGTREGKLTFYGVPLQK